LESLILPSTNSPSSISPPLFETCFLFPSAAPFSNPPFQVYTHPSRSIILVCLTGNTRFPFPLCPPLDAEQMVLAYHMRQSLFPYNSIRAPNLRIHSEFSSPPTWTPDLFCFRLFHTVGPSFSAHDPQKHLFRNSRYPLLGPLQLRWF